MKRNKIIFTVIKELDGSFSAIAHVGKKSTDLISAQANTWEELKTEALAAVESLTNHCKEIVSIYEIDYSFDLPSFLDAYPQLDATVLMNKESRTVVSGTKQPINGKKKVADKHLNRILEAVKQPAMWLLK